LPTAKPANKIETLNSASYYTTKTSIQQEVLHKKFFGFEKNPILRQRYGGRPNPAQIVALVVRAAAVRAATIILEGRRH